jgi:hypothetical protein
LKRRRYEDLLRKLPALQKKLSFNLNLQGLDVPRHCPHCDAYFDLVEEKTGRLPKGTAFMGLSKIDREVFYLPASEEK